LNKRSLGSEKERIAAEYLIQNGLKVIHMNYYCRMGEVDIIARDGEYLVFVEVKYRRNAALGHPLEAVDYRKQSRVRRAASFYIVQHSICDGVGCRFDVVAILGDEVTWVKDAF
jgi:putative endonuclease